MGHVGLTLHETLRPYQNVQQTAIETCALRTETETHKFETNTVVFKSNLDVELRVTCVD